MDSLTRLIPVSDCEAIIAQVEKRGEVKPSSEQAVKMAQLLMGMYPARAVNNADVFMTATSALFAVYDQDFCKRVCDPIDGLPSRLKYLPTIAEIKEALEAEKARRFKIKASAQWMIKERKRREDEAAEADKWRLSPEQIEARKAMVASALKPMRETTNAPGNQEGNGIDPAPNLGNSVDSGAGGDAGSSTGPG